MTLQERRVQRDVTSENATAARSTRGAARSAKPAPERAGDPAAALDAMLGDFRTTVQGMIDSLADTVQSVVGEQESRDAARRAERQLRAFIKSQESYRTPADLLSDAAILAAEVDAIVKATFLPLPMKDALHEPFLMLPMLQQDIADRAVESRGMTLVHWTCKHIKEQVAAQCADARKSRAHSAAIAAAMSAARPPAVGRGTPARTVRQPPPGLPLPSGPPPPGTMGAYFAAGGCRAWAEKYAALGQRACGRGQACKFVPCNTSPTTFQPLSPDAAARLGGFRRGGPSHQ